MKTKKFELLFERRLFTDYFDVASTLEAADFVEHEGYPEAAQGLYLRALTLAVLALVDEIRGIRADG